jgi:hypothetical protein
LIALAYREVVHSYPPEPESTNQERGMAAPELSSAVALGSQRGTVTQAGDLRLVQDGKRVKRVREHQHLRDLDISRVVLLMGFSTLGSIVQLPAVGGGSQLAVITALQVVYGVPAEMAVSCGIVLWLVTSMSCIPMGLVFAHREHLSLRRLSEESTHEERESMPLG